MVKSPTWEKKRLEMKINKGEGSSYYNDTPPEACKDEGNPWNYTKNLQDHESPNHEPFQFDEEDNVGSPSASKPQEEDHNFSHDFLIKQRIREK